MRFKVELRYCMKGKQLNASSRIHMKVCDGGWGCLSQDHRKGKKKMAGRVAGNTQACME